MHVYMRIEKSEGVNNYSVSPTTRTKLDLSEYQQQRPSSIRDTVLPFPSVEEQATFSPGLKVLNLQKEYTCVSGLIGYTV